MKCGSCDGQILDAEGELVCGKCGMVAGYGEEAPPIEAPVPIDPFNFGDMHPTTMTGNLVDHLGNRVANAGTMKRLVKQNRYSMSSSRSIPGAMLQVSMLRNALNMNDASSIYTAYLMRKIVSSGFLKGRTLKRCSVAAALVACRKYHVNRTMADMANASGVSKRQIFSTFNQLCETFDLTTPVQDPVEYIASIAAKANLDERVKRHAYAILRAVDRNELAGKDPKSLAAAVLYMSCSSLKVPVLRRDISEAAGVAGTTISNRYRVLAGILPENMVLNPPGLRHSSNKPRA